MAYNKTTWNEGIAPGISAANLNNLETQYDEVGNLFDAQTILIAISDNTPIALVIPASRIVGRSSAGNIVALTGAELMAILTGQAGAAFSMNSQRITSLGVPTTAGDALRKGTRVTVAELPALTDEKVWKGTGGDVEEIDPPRAFHETLLAAHNVSSIDTWEDYDLSALVPAGTAAVEVLMREGTSNPCSICGCRRNGSSNALNLFRSGRAYTYIPVGRTQIVECDVNRVIECYADAVSVNFYVIGYWS